MKKVRSVAPMNCSLEIIFLLNTRNFRRVKYIILKKSQIAKKIIKFSCEIIWEWKICLWFLKFTRNKSWKLSDSVYSLLIKIISKIKCVLIFYDFFPTALPFGNSFRRQLLLLIVDLPSISKKFSLVWVF